MIKKILSKINMLAIPICFVMYLVLNYMFCVMYFGEVTMLSWLFTIFWALLFCGILSLLPVNARRVGIVLTIVFFALSCIVHAVMYNLFGSFFAFSDLSYTGDGLAFFSFSYIKVRKLLWVTMVGSIVISAFLALRLKKERYTFKQAIIGLALVVIGIIGISIQHNKIMSGLNTQISWDVAGQKENEADIYQNMSNKNYTMSMTGIYQYLYRSFMLTSGLENRLSNGEMYKELDEYYKERSANAHVSNEMTGIFEGKNVFFIMLESIDTWMLKEEYMPNLYQVQQESINFVNHYSPLYIPAGTFNTEFIANTSLIPPASGIDTKVYKDNYFPTSLANAFGNAGYTANSFHSSNPHIYNRGPIHVNLGYNKYHNWTDMNMEHYMLDSQMINGYEKMTANKPFFSFVITYSGHGPYTEELNVISDSHIDAARRLVSETSINASVKDLEEYTYAIAHAMETDAFIGNLMERLGKENVLDDTVLVFFTDHYGKYMTSHQFVMEMKGVEHADFLCNTPFFIYHAGTEGKVVDTVSSTVDIAPTITNLFGLNVEYQYYTGVDIFSDEEHYVIFPGNGWYDGKIHYTINYDGEITEKIRNRNTEISRKMKCSEYTLKSNYFMYLDD
jgi:phosphoglycerol transferase MdoB-like AlkP superfamily enzyme